MHRIRPAHRGYAQPTAGRRGGGIAAGPGGPAGQCHVVRPGRLCVPSDRLGSPSPASGIALRAGCRRPWTSSGQRLRAVHLTAARDLRAVFLTPPRRAPAAPGALEGCRCRFHHPSILVLPLSILRPPSLQELPCQILSHLPPTTFVTTSPPHKLHPLAAVHAGRNSIETSPLAKSSPGTGRAGQPVSRELAHCPPVAPAPPSEPPAPCWTSEDRPQRTPP